MLHISPCCLVVFVLGLVVQALWEVPFLKLCGKASLVKQVSQWIDTGTIPWDMAIE